MKNLIYPKKDLTRLQETVYLHDWNRHLQQATRVRVDGITGAESDVNFPAENQGLMCVKEQPSAQLSVFLGPWPTGGPALLYQRYIAVQRSGGQTQYTADNCIL
jgi:hypothetical protein